MNKLDKSVYMEVNFENIVLGTLIATDCGGLLRLSRVEQVFQLKFHSEQNEEFAIIIPISGVKKIFKSLSQSQLILDFKLKPAAIRDVGEIIKKSDFTYQISKNSDEAKFQLYLNNVDESDIAYIESFFESIDIFDENVAKVINEPEQPEQLQQTPSKIHKPNLFKHRKKKFQDSDSDDGSQDYHPQKRQRKQSFSKVTADCGVIEDVPKRSLRVKKRDEVNLCEEMSEEAQIQEALKRSLKTADQTIIDSISHIDDQKIDQDLEQDEIYDNIDKAIELFTYNTSNGDIIVRMEDYLCLSRNEYLSDVIIDFYLHYIYNVKMTPEQREKTLIIGAHFYTLYATSSEYSGWNDGLNAGLNAKEKRYRRIDGILKENVNIFEKDFIIMPLMDHNHWFLAIVCFPKLNGSYTIDGNIKVDENDVKRNPKNVSQPSIKSSCILIFDSIKGNRHRRTAAFNHIKNFLEYEWINKYQEEFHFDVKCLNGHSPKVPLQMNNVDCGCFILEFMERFFVTSPIDDYRFPIDLADWFSPEEVRSSKRRELAAVIKSMMESANNQVELPKISFYGARKRKSSKSVQFVNLDNSLEDNNGNVDEPFRIPENGHSTMLENGNNGNNNDENFNNNNDFNCLNSNNTLQNNNVIHENQEAVHDIPRDEKHVDADVERVTTQEMMEYEQQCYVEDDGTAESIQLNTSDEMEVDEVTKLTSEVTENGQEAVSEIRAENGTKHDLKIENEAETVKNDANITKEAKTVFNDEQTVKNEAKTVINDATSDANAEKINNDAKTVINDATNDANAEKVNNDAKIIKSDATTPEIHTNGLVDEEEINEGFEFDKNELEITVIDAKSDADITKIDAKPEDGLNPVKSDAKANENDAKAVDAIKKADSDVMIMQLTPEKIDLTLDDSDTDEKAQNESNNKICDEIKEDDKMEIDPEPEPEQEQNNDQDKPEKEQEKNQKSDKLQPITDRISQSFYLMDSNIVLLD